MMSLKVITPERVIFEDTVDQLTFMSADGEITILPHHVPLVGMLKPGELLIKKSEVVTPMAISGGFFQVNEDGVALLADTAERFEEIVEARAQDAKERAEALRNEKIEDVREYAVLSAKIEKELARLHVARKYRGGARPSLHTEE